MCGQVDAQSDLNCDLSRSCKVNCNGAVAPLHKGIPTSIYLVPFICYISAWN